MSFINRVRLPIKLSRPQLLEERDTFRKANGVTKTLSVVIRKQYEGSTEYMPEKMHDRLKIALGHDNVEIEGEKYIGGVVAEPDYQIDWPEFLDYPLGTAKFKVNVTPFNVTNSNCGTCEDLTQVITNDDNIGGVDEGSDLVVPILDNDSICCNPFEISIITFNADYVDSGSVVGNDLHITLKNPVVTQNNVILATYRVTCDNGQYDEADVIANVTGSEEGCLSPTDVLANLGTGGVADPSWTAPSPAPDSYAWQLYESDDLITPVMGGFTAALTVNITGLTVGQEYVFKVNSVCGEDASNSASVTFTVPFVETTNCNQYKLVFNDGTGIPGNGTSISYLACDDEYHSVFVPNAVSRAICCKENSPGSPTYIQSHSNVTVTYEPANPRGCGNGTFI